MEQVKRKTIAVDLTPRAREVIDGIRDDTGVPNTEAMARLLEWFAGLDRKLRLAVLTRDIDTRNELLALALRDMAAEAATVEPFGPIKQLDLDQLQDLQDQIGHQVARKRKAARAKKPEPHPPRSKPEKAK